MNSTAKPNATAGTDKRPDTRRGGTHIVACVVLFVLFSVAAVMLLLAAGAMLLAEWLGSCLLAAAVLGGFMALLALCVYLIWIRPAAMRAAERIETVYSAAAMTGEAIGWVREKYRFLRLLLAVIRRRL